MKSTYAESGRPQYFPWLNEREDKRYVPEGHEFRASFFRAMTKEKRPSLLALFKRLVYQDESFVFGGSFFDVALNPDFTTILWLELSALSFKEVPTGIKISVKVKTSLGAGLFEIFFVDNEQLAIEERAILLTFDNIPDSFFLSFTRAVFDFPCCRYAFPPLNLDVAGKEKKELQAKYKSLPDFWRFTGGIWCKE